MLQKNCLAHLKHHSELKHRFTFQKYSHFYLFSVFQAPLSVSSTLVKENLLEVENRLSYHLSKVPRFLPVFCVHN